MTAEQLRAALLRQWRLIAALAVCMGLGALVASQFMTHEYRAFAVVQVVVNPANPNPSYVLGGDSLVATEDQLATSPALLAATAKRYSGLTTAKLTAETEATQYGNTTLMQITVLDTSPTRAASLANDIAAALVAAQERTREQQNASFLKPYQDKLAALQKDIETTSASLQTLPNTPENANQIATLQAHLKSVQAQDTQQEQTIATIEVDQALKGFTLQLAQPAQPNYVAVRPILVANVLGGVVSGVLLGLLLVIALELRDQRRPVTVRFLVDSDMPLLAAISATTDTGASGGSQGSQGRQQDALAPAPARSDLDAYHSVQTALELWNLEQPVRVLAVAGIGASETSATVAAHLAVSLAATGEPILLLEAQTTPPSQAQRFGIQGENGLNSAVVALRERGSDQAAPAADKVMHFMYAATTINLPTLRIIPAGSPWPNAQRVLRSPAVTHVLDASLASGARRVLIDAPALLQSSASRALAAKSDGALLVIDPARDRKHQLLRVRNDLAQAGIRILGCVWIEHAVVADDVPASRAAAPGTSQRASQNRHIAPVPASHASVFGG